MPETFIKQAMQKEARKGKPEGTLVESGIYICGADCRSIEESFMTVRTFRTKKSDGIWFTTFVHDFYRNQAPASCGIRTSHGEVLAKLEDRIYRSSILKVIYEVNNIYEPVWLRL